MVAQQGDCEQRECHEMIEGAVATTEGVEPNDDDDGQRRRQRTANGVIT